MIDFFSSLAVLYAINTGGGLSIIGTWIGIGFLVGVLSMFMFVCVLMLLLKVMLLFMMDGAVIVVVFVSVKFN